MYCMCFSLHIGVHEHEVVATIAYTGQIHMMKDHLARTISFAPWSRQLLHAAGKIETTERCASWMHEAAVLSQAVE